MKILHISEFKLLNSPNGVHHAIWSYAREQAKLGHTVGILTRSSEIRAEETRICRDHGVLLKVFPASRYNPFFIPKEVFRWIFNKFAPDVVHFHYVFQPWVYSIARRLKTEGIPFLVTPHAGYCQGLLARKGLKKQIASALYEKRKLSWANLAHAQSQEEVQEIRNYGFKGNIVCIRNGIDLKEVCADADDSQLFRANLHLPVGSTLGIFLGRLDPYQKGLDLLLEALHRCKKEIEDAAFFVLLIGPDVFGEKIDLIHKIKALGLGRIVNFAGAIYGPARFAAIQAGDIFILPSRWEGNPLTLLEAMALGRPLFVTQETGMGNEVKEYQAGVVARAEVDSLAAGLLEVLRNRSNLAEWGKNARRLVEEKHNPGALVSELVSHYANLVRGE